MSQRASRTAPDIGQLTIRELGPELSQKVRKLAREEGTSLNKAVLILLQRGAGMVADQPASDVIGDSLDHLVGSMSGAEAEAVMRSLEAFEEIDPSFWR